MARTATRRARTRCFARCPAAARLGGSGSKVVGFMALTKSDPTTTEAEAVDLRSRCHGVLDTPVTFLSPRELMAAFADAIMSDRRALVFHQNLHGVYLQQRDASYQALFRRCDYAYADGMPLVGLARLAGRDVSRHRRATYLDWEDEFLDRCAAEQWPVFYIGGRPDSLEEGLAALRARHPGLLIDGHHGYFDHGPGSAESASVVAAANDYEAALVFVGMGMPLQERWAVDHRAELEAPLVVTIGAGIDYASGAIKSPPRWAGRLGLEWVYRFAAEPRRLAFRYTVEPVWLAVQSVRRAVDGRRS